MRNRETGRSRGLALTLSNSTEANEVVAKMHELELDASVSIMI